MYSNISLGIVGAGNMGGAILQGVLAGGLPRENVHIYDANEQRCKDLASANRVNAAGELGDIARYCNTIIFAVKPDDFMPMLNRIKLSERNESTLYISVAAGISISSMEYVLGRTARVIRVMPNTPARVGEGMTAVCPGGNATPEDTELACELFGMMGRTEVMDEGLINAAAGISGCSPAYVYMFIEALADAGVAHGLGRKAAYAMAAQSVLGAAKMVLETGSHPGDLKDEVCSPGGATIEAVMSLEQSGMRGAVMGAVNSAVSKMACMSK